MTKVNGSKNDTRNYKKLLEMEGITIALSIVIVIIATIDKGPYILVNSVITGGIYTSMSMGLALVFGVMNIPQFAHGEFFMIGSLTAYFVISWFNKIFINSTNLFIGAVAPIISMFIALLIGAVFGVIIEKILFSQLRKRSRENWVMNTFLLTLGISVFLINGHQLIFGTNLKGIVNYWDVPALHLFGISLSVDRLIAFIVSIISMSFLGILLKFTRTGQAIRAVSQDESGAKFRGINTKRIYVLTLALSCGVAALSGASVLFMFPSYPTVGFRPLYMSWFVVIAVGLGNIPGCLAGGFMVALIQVLTTAYVGEGWDFVIPAVLICIVIIVKPSGIFGTGVRVSIHER